jgi:hypothetical protein
MQPTPRTVAMRCAPILRRRLNTCTSSAPKRAASMLSGPSAQGPAADGALRRSTARSRAGGGRALHGTDIVAS